MFQKRWTFGFGTVFSLIVIYFIYLYSKDKGWTFLALAAKWYLIIIGGFLALTMGIALLAILFALLIFLVSMLRLHSLRKRETKQKSKGYIDAEYKVKD